MADPGLRYRVNATNTRPPGYSAGELARSAASALYEPVADIAPGLGDLRALGRAEEEYRVMRDAFAEREYLSAVSAGARWLAEQLSVIPALGEAATLGKIAATAVTRNALGRSDLQKLLKQKGLPATGKTDELAELYRISETAPSEWSKQDFDKVKNYIYIHQDTRGDHAERIMKEGLTSGMVDSLGNMDRGEWTWARKLLGSEGGAYLFWPGDIKYRHKDSAWIESAKPFYRFTPEENEDIYSALTKNRERK